ncbi:hypothetical protein QTO34_000852 [Cnephaeus nilssonii]|uniref:Uncharacterized protein n=1 Tax=Cnephaeus nilssonii TaxID=3371016 RepID=A0AA40ID62_CNENI|nr:hypothetical protein QTO34_000852 [Eptesicus nilssonii]
MAFVACVAKLKAEASYPICLDYLVSFSVLSASTTALIRTSRELQLYHMTDIVQQILTMRRKRKRQDKPQCKKHQELMTQFCEKDLEQLISPIPIEEATASHRRKLKRYIVLLMIYLKDAETVYENQVAKTLKVKRKMKNGGRNWVMNVKNLSIPWKQRDMKLTAILSNKRVICKLTITPLHKPRPPAKPR